MTASRAALVSISLIACLLAAACAGQRAWRATPDRPVMGLYKGRLEQPSGDSHRFRLLLFAELPDRMHGELLSPLGSPQMIVDGGAGELAITLVRRGLSYVGRSDPDVMEGLVGVRLTLEGLVRAVLEGQVSGGGHQVSRSGEERRGLPERLEIRSAGSRLTLELKQLLPVRAPAGELGTGRPPEGMELRPLDELDREGRPLSGKGGS